MKKQTKKRIGLGLLGVILVAVVFFFVYVNDYYRATENAQAALADTELVEVTEGDPIVFEPDNPNSQGIIFYPGGKVETEAYAPIMKKLAEAGITGYLVEVPFHLAVFDINAADPIIQAHPEISDWYIAGHSLGGSMGASFAGKTDHKLAGLILLAAYSTSDLTEKELPVLSILASNDEVLNGANYNKNLPNLDSANQVTIEGGNHGQFGDYGEQEGDGEATISPEEQHEQVVAAILSFMATEKASD